MKMNQMSCYEKYTPNHTDLSFGENNKPTTTIFPASEQGTFLLTDLFVGSQLCWKDHLVFVCNAVCSDIQMYVCMCVLIYVLVPLP